MLPMYIILYYIIYVSILYEYRITLYRMLNRLVILRISRYLYTIEITSYTIMSIMLKLLHVYCLHIIL